MIFDSLVEDYQKKGFCIAHQLFSDNEIISLDRLVTDFIDRYSSKMDGRDINYINEEINSIHCVHKFPDSALFRTFVNHSKVLELGEALLGDDPEIRASELFLKPAYSGLPSPLHQDNFYWCVKGDNALTIWIALDESGPDNGGVQYIEGSHNWGLVNHVNSYAPGSSQKVEESEKVNKGKRVCPQVNPGDALIHHSLTIHGSSANASPKSRRGLTIQLKGKSSEYDLERKADYERKLQSQVDARK